MAFGFELVADDGGASADPVTARVVPPNQAPLVSAGPDETIFSPSTLLRGVVTDDGLPLGSSLTTSWSAVSGPGIALFGSPLQPASSVQFTASGSYVLRLTASDGSRSASDEVRVTADVTNVAPSVSAGADQTIVFPQTTLTLSGVATDDGLPLGSTVQVVWNQISGPALASFSERFSVSTNASFPAAGRYVLSLLASDGDLLGSDELTVVVEDGNAAPSVDAGGDQSVTLPTNQITLFGFASDDALPAGSVVSYLWSRVSGPAAVSFSNPNAASTLATFEASGDYVLRLTVTDGLLSGSDTLGVHVEPGPPLGPAPSVAIVSPTERQAVTDFTEVVGTVSSEALVSWTLESEGTRIASGTTAVSNGVFGVLDPTLLQNGLHEIRLTATDTAGRTAVDTVFVVVKENLKVGQFTVSFVDLEVLGWQRVEWFVVKVPQAVDRLNRNALDFIGLGVTGDDTVSLCAVVR